MKASLLPPTVRGCGLNDCADVPQSVELPVALVIHAESNCMSRDVQSQLRKKSYDFARADAVLTDLGVRNTWQGHANKKAKPNDKGQKRQQGEPAANTDLGQPASKRPCTNAETTEAAQATAQAADAAADAQAESILHVPETSAMPAGTAQLNGHVPDNSALSSIPPGPQSVPDANPPTAQTSLAAAAAAALGGQPAAASNGVLEQPAPASNGVLEQPAPASNGVLERPAPASSNGVLAPPAHGPEPDGVVSKPSASDMNGHASSSIQHVNGDSAKLYDVNRYIFGLMCLAGANIMIINNYRFASHGHECPNLGSSAYMHEH